MSLRNLLFDRLRALLWGDRDRWGLTPKLDDPYWKEWQNTYSEFYQANQLQGIGTRVNDFSRLMKPGGFLIGAIPAEDGASWEAGISLTSPRWLKKNTTIYPDKIIFWHHPNFVDQILLELHKVFTRKIVKYWPLRSLPFMDTNLVVRQLYSKSLV